jgi:hypothetical protein
LYFGYFMFLLVTDIHFSDIGCLDRQKQQRHVPCPIRRTSVNGASTIFRFASSVIYVPIGCTHPYTRYWHSLLVKTIAACSLPYPENKRHWSVKSFSYCIFGYRGIARIITFILESLTALLRKYKIPQR